MRLRDEVKTFEELEFLPLVGTVESFRLGFKDKRNLLENGSYKLLIPIVIENITAGIGVYLSVSRLYNGLVRNLLC